MPEMKIVHFLSVKERQKEAKKDNNNDNDSRERLTFHLNGEKT